MNKRILSALLALCLTCSMAGTALAAGGQATPETARAAAAAAPAQPADAAPQPEEEPSADATSQPEEDTAAAQPAAATAETAAPATPETAALPARTVEVTDAASGITVTVDVPEGALPADAELQVTLLGGGAATPETAQTPDDVAGELDGAGIEYDDFVSMDLTFYDAAGQEVEPLKPVQVRFTLPAALLPDDVDPATLAVQHLAEDENGEVEAVETLADAADTADGTVTLDGDVTAAFETDGFSVYVLTYSAKAAPRAGEGSTYTFTYNWDYEYSSVSDRTVTLNFDIVDTNGNPIPQCPDYEYELTYKTTGLPTDMPEDLQLSYVQQGGDHFWRFLSHNFNNVHSCTATGTQPTEQLKFKTNDPGKHIIYDFVEAVYIDDTGRHPLSGVEVGRFYGAGDTVGIRLYDGIYSEYDVDNTVDLNMPLNYKNAGYYTITENKNQNAKLQLIYRNRDEIQKMEDPEPSIGKEAVLQEGGTYDLSLDVSSRTDLSSENKQKVDVLFILDGSRSMKNGSMATDDGTTKTRLAAMNDSIDTIVNQLETQSEDLDIRYSAVQFGRVIGSNYDESTEEESNDSYFHGARQLIGYNTSSWTSSAKELKTAIEQYSVEDELTNGTNTQAGLMMAQAALLEARPDARQYVILISDGRPANYYYDNGLTFGTGESSSAVYALLHTYEALGKLRKKAYILEENEANIDFVNGMDQSPLDGLYFVYVGDGADLSYEETINGTKYSFEQLFAYYAYEDTPTDFYVVDDLNELESTFSELTSIISAGNYSKVVAKDVLSEYVEPVQGAQPEVTITRTVQKIVPGTPVEGQKPEMIEFEVPKTEEEWKNMEATDPRYPYRHLLNPMVADIDPATGIHLETTHNIYDEVTAELADDGESFQLVTNSFQDGAGNQVPYTLRPGYTYTVKLDVQTTDAAVGYLTDNGFTYPATADADTGTYAEQAGLYSNDNDNSKLTYDLTFSGALKQDQEKLFPKPVVRPFVKADVTKTFEGFNKQQPMDGDTAAKLIKDLRFEITTTVKDTSGAEQTETTKVLMKDATPDTSGLVYTKSDVLLPYGEIKTTGALQEYGGQLADHSREMSYTTTWNDTTDPQKYKVAVTNEYIYNQNYVTLTISKTVGGPMGSYDDDFDFKLLLSMVADDGSTIYWGNPLEIETGTNADGYTVGGTIPKDTGNVRTYTFTLSHEEQIVLKVPQDFAAKVEEVDGNNGYTVKCRQYKAGVSVNAANAEGANAGIRPAYEYEEQKPSFGNYNPITVEAMDDNYVVEFQNTREAVAPTGLEGDHTAPYVLMVSASALAGMALLGGVAARRARRRREW